MYRCNIFGTPRDIHPGLQCSGGSRGRPPPPPSGQIFFNFMQFSGTLIKFYLGAPFSKGGAPPCENPGSATDFNGIFTGFYGSFTAPVRNLVNSRNIIWGMAYCWGFPKTIHRSIDTNQWKVDIVRVTGKPRILIYHHR